MLEFLLQNDFISALIAFGIVLIPAVIIHELGHFLAAKMVGITILEFGVGFPPRMFRLFNWGETEITINWLPIGGFVRPMGEDMIGPVNNDANDADEPEKRKNTPPEDEGYISERDELIARGYPPGKIKALNEAKPLQRIFFMSAGAFANFATAIFLFTVIALIGLPKIVGARAQIVYFPPDSMYAGQDVQPGDAVEQINGELFADMSTFFMTLAEAETPVTLTLRSLETLDTYTIVVTPDFDDTTAYVYVAGVAEGSPADEAGILAADLIVAVNGQRLPVSHNPTEALQKIVAEQAGQTLQLTLMREGATFETSLTPRVDPPPGEGRLGLAIESQYATSDGIRYTDTSPQVENIPQTPADAVKYGLTRTATTLGMIVEIPMKLIQGAISPEEARPVSIIGISQVGGKFLQQSIRDGNPSIILNFIALVSIFLGFTNLLPIPPMDGGRIVFVIAEMLRGKPVPFEIENMVYRIGLAILLSLGVLVILYDIFNPFKLPS